MNRTLFLRLLRRNLLALAVYGGVLFGFEFAIVSFYPTFGTTKLGGFFDLGRMMEMLPEAMRSFFGGKSAVLTGFQGYLSFAFTHPLVLFLLLGLPIGLASRSVAGEVGGGTSELLFSRPVLRRTVVLTNAIVLVLAQCVAGFCAWAGLVLAVRVFAIDEPLRLGWLTMATLDAVVLTLACGFLTLAASSTVRTQGRALGIGAGVTVFFYIFNVIADLWTEIAPLKKLGLFHYFEPGSILAGGGHAVRDLIVAGLVGLVCLVAAVWVAERRDL